MAIARICSIEGCGKPVKARGWCSSHYGRWRTHGDPVAGGTQWGAALAFLEDALVSETDDCIPWPFSRTTQGSGRIYICGKFHVAARVVCRRVHGAPPTPEHETAHNCGKGHEGCVNPRHLRWATRVENQADRLIHDTHSRGERHGASKLSESDVLDIRKRVGAGETKASLAREYELHPTTVGQIVSRKRWAWLD